MLNSPNHSRDHQISTFRTCYKYDQVTLSFLPLKSIKVCLRKVIEKAILSCKEMSTLFVQTKAILSLRPLTYVYNENEELEPFTPMHFLNFGKETSLQVNFFDAFDDGSKWSSLLKIKRYQSPFFVFPLFSYLQSM